MAIDVITAVIRLAPGAVSPSERAVLFCLAWHANANGLNAWPAVATIARETSLTGRAVQKVLRRLLVKGFVVVDGTRARRSVVYAIDMAVLDRERYSQSEPSDREPRSQTPTEIEVFHSRDCEPRSPLNEPRSPDPEPRSRDCEPRSPDPDLNRHEPSEKKYPGAGAPVISLPDKGNSEDHEKTYAVVKRLAFDAIDELGPDAQFADLSGALKDLVGKNHIPYDSGVIGAALVFALSARRSRLRATA